MQNLILSFLHVYKYYTVTYYFPTMFENNMFVGYEKSHKIG